MRLNIKSSKYIISIFAIITLVTLVNAIVTVNADRDNDGISDRRDNCLYVQNPDQDDTNRNKIGDACDPDFENAIITCCLGENLANDHECFQTSIQQCEQLDGAVMECLTPERGKTKIGEAVNITVTNATTQAEWLQNLTRAVNSTNVSNQGYRAGHICHHFSDELERNLTTLGYNATFTAFWCYDNAGNTIRNHAVTDVHAPDGSIVFIEPQNGKIINMDFDGDGIIEVRTHHEGRKILTDDNCEIEVYDNKASAQAAGVPMG